MLLCLLVQPVKAALAQQHHLRAKGGNATNAYETNPEPPTLARKGTLVRTGDGVATAVLCSDPELAKDPSSAPWAWLRPSRIAHQGPTRSRECWREKDNRL